MLNKAYNFIYLVQIIVLSLIIDVIPLIIAIFYYSIFLNNKMLFNSSDWIALLITDSEDFFSEFFEN